MIEGEGEGEGEGDVLRDLKITQPQARATNSGRLKTFRLNHGVHEHANERLPFHGADS